MFIVDGDGNITEAGTKLSDKYAPKDHTHEALTLPDPITCNNLSVGERLTLGGGVCYIEKVDTTDPLDKRLELYGANEYRINFWHSSFNTSSYRWINIGGWGYPLMYCKSDDNNDPDGNNPLFYVDRDGNIKCSSLNTEGRIQVSTGSADTPNYSAWSIRANYHNGMRRLIFQDDVSYKHCYLNALSNHINLNTTITHNAPVTENIDKYDIGKPVFLSGQVYHYDTSSQMYIEGHRNAENCIPSVKSSGSYREYLGICVAKHESRESVTIGDVIKSDVIINENTIDFATHGDFIFKVDDSSEYSIGDTVLYDGSILDDEIPLTNRLRSSIAGIVTGIIDKNTITLFKV